MIVCVRMMGWGIKEEKMQELKDLVNLIKNESNGSGKVKFLPWLKRSVSSISVHEWELTAFSEMNTGSPF